METNMKINFEELERLAKVGGTDHNMTPTATPALSPIVSATVKVCISVISGLTTFFSCNRTCGWGC